MTVILYLVSFPLAGLMAGECLGRLAQSYRALDRVSIAGPMILVLVFVVTEAFRIAVAVATYSGSCSGYRERGYHPCSLAEFVFQDWDFGIVLSLIPLLVGAGIGFLTFAVKEKDIRPRATR